MEKALENQKLDSLQLDKASARMLLKNIRNAKMYRDGIATSGPIVNSVVLNIQNRLDELQADIPSILLGFDREIEREYGATKNNYIRLIRLQEKIILSVTRLYRARIGDCAELDTLLQEDASLSTFITSAGKSAPAQLTAAEIYLLDQLSHIDAMLDQLEETKVEYHAKQDELTAWRIQLEEKIMIARNAMTIWAQSHHNLGAGIPVPPLIDMAGFASGLVSSAAKTVIP